MAGNGFVTEVWGQPIEIVALRPRRAGRVMEDSTSGVYPHELTSDLGWMDRRLQRYHQEILNVANKAHKVFSDNMKFDVALDVSHFTSEELLVHNDGCDSDDCDLDSVYTLLDESGDLQFKATKTGRQWLSMSVPQEEVIEQKPVNMKYFH